MCVCISLEDFVPAASVCILVCIYICIYVFCICMYTCVYVHMHICILVCMYICMYVYLNVCTYTYMQFKLEREIEKNATLRNARLECMFNWGFPDLPAASICIPVCMYVT